MTISTEEAKIKALFEEQKYKIFHVVVGYVLYIT